MSNLPWHIPLEGVPEFREQSKAPESSLFKHYCNLNIHENTCEELQTGLMCDISTNNQDPSIIQRLIASGMTIARLNLRDLKPETSSQLIQSIRQAVYNYSAELEYLYPLAVIVDVRGPDIVTGELKSGPKTTIELLQFGTIRLTTDASWRECGTTECLFVGYDHLTNLNVDDIIYVDSLGPGRLKLVVTNVGDDSIECSVAVGGIIGENMTVRISTVPKEISDQKAKRDSADSISDSEDSQEAFEHINEQLAWAVNSDVDGVFVPCVQNINDVKQIKDSISEKGKHILVFACIESVLGLNNIDEILNEADGIYVDRCILSTDLAVEKIFIALKVIVAKCNSAGKPCIVKAVINEQIPILSVTDIANVVLDGADVLAMELNYDSPLKKIVLTHDSLRMAEHCLAAATVVCRHAERIVWQPYIYGNMELMQSTLNDPTQAICVSAVELSVRSRAVVIICLTNSGRTAKNISHGKPMCPIIAVTRACHTARQLRFWRGVRSLHFFEAPKENWHSETESRIRAALDYCKAKRIIHAGDPYVVVIGYRKGAGYCDCVRLLYASARDAVFVE